MSAECSLLNLSAIFFPYPSFSKESICCVPCRLLMRSYNSRWVSDDWSHVSKCCFFSLRQFFLQNTCCDDWRYIFKFYHILVLIKSFYYIDSFRTKKVWHVPIFLTFQPHKRDKDVQRCSQYVKDLMSSGVCFLLTMQKQCEREQCKLAYSCRVLPVFAFLIAKLRHSRVALSVSVRFRRIWLN